MLFRVFRSSSWNVLPIVIDDLDYLSVDTSSSLARWGRVITDYDTGIHLYMQ